MRGRVYNVRSQFFFLGLFLLTTPRFQRDEVFISHHHTRNRAFTLFVHQTCAANTNDDNVESGGWRQWEQQLLLPHERLQLQLVSSSLTLAAREETWRAYKVRPRFFYF